MKLLYIYANLIKAEISIIEKNATIEVNMLSKLWFTMCLHDEDDHLNHNVILKNVK